MADYSDKELRRMRGVVKTKDSPKGTLYIPSSTEIPSSLNWRLRGTLNITALSIVHPESFRSNAQNAIAFAHRNCPRVNRSDVFACVHLRLRAFASTVCDRARTCVQSRVHAYIRAQREVHLKSIVIDSRKSVLCTPSAPV